MLSRWTKSIMAFAHDTAAAGIAFLLAIYLRMGDRLFDIAPNLLISNLLLFVATCAGVFLFSGLYRSIWAYASVRDLGALLKAVTIAIALYMAMSFAFTRLEAIPRSTPIISWFIMLAVLGGSRLSYRLLREGRLSFLWQNAGAGRTPVLLYGAGDEADLFIRALAANPQAPYEVVGVVAENIKRVGRDIHSVPVLGTLNDLNAIVSTLRKKNRAPVRLILTKSAAEADSPIAAQLLEDAKRLGLSLSRAPQVTRLQDDGGKAVTDVPIAIEDLLGRPETVLNRDAINHLAAGRVVMVTGAGGTIGSELCRQIAALKPSKLVLLEFGEFNLYTINTELHDAGVSLPIAPYLADVRDAARVKQIFQDEKPDLIFHAAALKHVPIAEYNARETVLTNVLGTKNIIDAAANAKAAAVVLISTDKAVNPSSVMGATKRVAEMLVQAVDEDHTETRALAVRFGNVLGSTGSVVPRFKEQIAKGGPVTVTHPDMTRFFMSVREAVELVLQASAFAIQPQAKRGRIMLLDMGKPVKIMDLARQMIRLAGLQPDQDIKIVVSGLRPGEKLHEELVSASEKIEKAEVDGVNLVSPPALPPSFAFQLAELLKTAETMADQELVKQQLERVVNSPAVETKKTIPPAA